MGSPLSLLTPTQNESVNAEQVNFKWKKLGGVNFYVLTIAKDANFTQDVRDFTTSEAEYKVELAGYEQEYYWKVQAISLAKYNYGQTVTSAVGSFVFTLGTGLSATDVRYYTPDVDGVRDAAYASSARMVLGQEYQASPDASAVPATDTTATGYLIWDENNLYVYADVNKTGIFSNPLLNGGTSENAYLQDCVQIDLQTKNSQLYSVIVHGDGDGYYCTLNGWTGDAKYAVVPKADGSGYSVEFAVPFGEGMQ
ncbi:MAG: sugar-binding protein, partial [Clostridia bacterium]